MWAPDDPGALVLPSGRIVRGRGLRRGAPVGAEPEYGLYLLGERPGQQRWPSTWLRWPDFRLPDDRAAARHAYVDALQRAGVQRVEVACDGGRGRTGTALACIAILDGVPPDEAVGYVRAHYHPRAIETPAQKRYVRSFAPE